MTLAEVLDAERQRQDLSVNALAIEAELSPSRIHDILTGKVKNPGLLTVQRITRAMGKTLGWLERQMKS